METTMLVKHKETGKIYSFPAHLMDKHPEFEEVSVGEPKSYKELKKDARDKGLEFKGNISKEELEKLLSK